MMRRGRVCVAANVGTVPVVLSASTCGATPARLLLASDPAISLDTDIIGDSSSVSVGLPAASVAVFA